MRVERWITRSESLVHGREPVNDGIGLVRLHRGLRDGGQLDRFQAARVRHVEHVDVVADRDPGEELRFTRSLLQLGALLFAETPEGVGVIRESRDSQVPSDGVEHRFVCATGARGQKHQAVAELPETARGGLLPQLLQAVRGRPRWIDSSPIPKVVPVEHDQRRVVLPVWHAAVVPDATYLECGVTELARQDGRRLPAHLANRDTTLRILQQHDERRLGREAVATLVDMEVPTCLLQSVDGPGNQVVVIPGSENGSDEIRSRDARNLVRKGVEVGGGGQSPCERRTEPLIELLGV
jgi:hypothetical protein